MGEALSPPPWEGLGEAPQSFFLPVSIQPTIKIISLTKFYRIQIF
jgi:hypothetical protein